MLCSSIFVFLIHDYFCSVSLGLLYVFGISSPVFFIFIFSVLAKRLAGECISEMLHFMLSVMKNLN